MNYNDFVRSVAGATGLTRKQADQAVVNTLTVLAEIISAEETKDLLAQLPKSIRERVPVSGETMPMRPIELVARVADLGSASVDDAERNVRAVFQVLTEAVNAGEINDIATELGADYADLLQRPRPTSPLTRAADETETSLAADRMVSPESLEQAEHFPANESQLSTDDVVETMANAVAHVVHDGVSIALRPAVVTLRRLRLLER
jgi:uncharacterized protein (DUF2267 family)